MAVIMIKLEAVTMIYNVSSVINVSNVTVTITIFFTMIMNLNFTVTFILKVLNYIVIVIDCN